MRYRVELERMYELAPSLVAITRGPQHIIIYANNALRQKFGHVDLIGRPALEVVPSPTDRLEIRAYLDTVFNTGAPLTRYAVSMSEEVAPGKFEARFFNSLYHPLTDNAGNILGVFVEGHPTPHPLENERRASQTEDELTDHRGLTKRHRQVLACLVEGLSNKLIAHRLGLSERTVEMHRAGLLDRLGVSSTSQLIGLVAHNPVLAVIADAPENLPALIAPETPKDKRTSGTAQRLASALEVSHANLLVEMLGFEGMTSGEAPTKEDFLRARQAISEASLKRRNLASIATTYVLTRVAGEQNLAVQRVVLNDQDLLNLSAAHTRKWTDKAALEMWGAYCEASRQIRRHMAAQISLERSVLMPQLREL